MCVSCRQRFEQKKLFRFICKDKQLYRFDGVGRSSYLCGECIEDDKKIAKSIFRLCKNKNMGYISQLKESLVDVR
jgi:predicted RNA-binding protein YlxR (DUF448 family)